MRTPKKQGWSDTYYQLTFCAVSDHSMRASLDVALAMTQCQQVTIYIRGVYLPGFLLIPSLLMLGLAAAFTARRGVKREDLDGSNPTSEDPFL
jgi:hypothetical protein